jgi:hypothetical protein
VAPRTEFTVLAKPIPFNELTPIIDTDLDLTVDAQDGWYR